MFSVVLLLAFLPQASQSAPAKDALALLNEVSQRYADAKSYHIEAVEERTSRTELTHHWDRMLLTAIVMADGRYHYEGRSGFGQAILISDGSSQWDYHPYDHAYTEQPASSDDPLKGHVIGPQEGPLLTAKSLLFQIAHKVDRGKAAEYLPEERISLNGRSSECYVVRYFDERPEHENVKFEVTLWIEKARRVVLKTISRGETYMLTMDGGHIPMSTETITTYPVVEFEQAEPASSFSFVAPADAELLTEFPDHLGRNPESVADLMGKPAPELQLKSTDGRVTTLSSFHGKPVFVEFWANWCEPCVALMPGLTKLYAETTDKGLVWLSIDSNKDTSATAAFLARERASWPNYHDGDSSIGKAFHRSGIPLGVLIDRDGEITYYKTGYGIDDLRAAIAKLGPEFSSVAPAGASATGASSK
jgi:thiol-disulfide isomerase/thioredoxin